MGRHCQGGSAERYHSVAQEPVQCSDGRAEVPSLALLPLSKAEPRMLQAAHSQLVRHTGREEGRHTGRGEEHRTDQEEGRHTAGPGHYTAQAQAALAVLQQGQLPGAPPPPAAPAAARLAAPGWGTPAARGSAAPLPPSGRTSRRAPAGADAS